MRITLEYRNPTPSHCDIAVFVNGALSGVLTLRQDEVGSLSQIITHGCAKGIDSFLSRGKSVWKEPDPLDRLIALSAEEETLKTESVRLHWEWLSECLQIGCCKPSQKR